MWEDADLQQLPWKRSQRWILCVNLELIMWAETYYWQIEITEVKEDHAGELGANLVSGDIF